MAEEKTLYEKALAFVMGRGFNRVAAEKLVDTIGPEKIMETETKRVATHRPECGVVGETGAHGDLGSNAADYKAPE